MFYWICHCSAMNEILDYDGGQIHVVRRWAQELLGYHFSVIHRPAHMMADADALSHCYFGLVCQYILYAAQLSAAGCARRPAAFPAHATKCPAAVAVAGPPSTNSTTTCSALFTSAQIGASLPSADLMSHLVDRVAFTSCPALLVPSIPPAMSSANSGYGSTLRTPIRSFTTSERRPKAKHEE